MDNEKLTIYISKNSSFTAFTPFQNYAVALLFKYFHQRALWSSLQFALFDIVTSHSGRMSAAQCLRHEWLSTPLTNKRRKALTNKTQLKDFMARIHWKVVINYCLNLYVTHGGFQ